LGKIRGDRDGSWGWGGGVGTTAGEIGTAAGGIWTAAGATVLRP
jgi:hypothetical protein